VTAPSPAAPATAPAPRPAAPAASAGHRDELVPLSRIRKLTGDHMVASLATSPHAFSVVEVDYENVARVRSAHKDAWKASEGFSLTFLPFITRAVVDAIAEFPYLNASVGEHDLIVHKYVDMGIAVDLAYQGLVVPVVRDADAKRLRAIAREINDLATRAKNKRLLPEEIVGGTFTISNNGSAGSVLTAAVINQPQVAIISTDAIVRKPVVVELPGGGEAIAIHSVGNLAMSWDHRAFDGAYAANFLVRVKEILETRDWEAEL
jgi:2-oxoglutarate dehydrogenase E2 component (dihydrolipoamide succinyltransferase)